MLGLHKFTFNPFQENTWIIYSEQKNCIIIDPGCYSAEEKNTLKNFIDSHQLNPVKLINTHCHIDHVLGNRFVFDTWGLQPEIHSLELPLLKAVEQYGSMWGIHSDPQPEPLLSLSDGAVIELDGEILHQIFTPGHAPGEISLYHKGQQFLIAGDVLFYQSIGRTDLPGGDHATLLDTIRNRLFVLPDEVQVHPGHGPSTTIGHEKKNNPFVNMSA